jgi:hypothetical protein
MSMYPIATYTNTTPASTVTFNNIPQNFTHLQVRMITRINAPGNNNWYADLGRFNGDATASNYFAHSAVQMYSTVGGGAATLASSYDTTNGLVLNNSLMEAGVSLNYMTATIFDVLDYTNTNKFKTYRSFYGFVTVPTPCQVGLFSGVWKNTSAVTSLTIYNPINNWTSNTRFDLYGISTSNTTGA